MVLASGTVSPRPRPRKRRKTQPFLDLKLDLLVRERGERLDHQDLEHHDLVKGWAPAFGAIGSPHGSLELWTEQLEINGPAQALQRVALLRQLREPVSDVENLISPAIYNPRKSVSQSTGFYCQPRVFGDARSLNRARARRT